MPRSSSALERSAGRVSSAGLPPEARASAGDSGEDGLRVTERSDNSPGDETPSFGKVRFTLVTESGFEVALVTAPTQAARLLRVSNESNPAVQPGDGDRETLKCRMVRRPRPVSVHQLLSRARLVSRVESPLGVGAL